MQPPRASLLVFRQQLVEQQRATLTSTHIFSQYCLDMITRTMAIKCHTVKQYLLQTLVSSCPSCLLT